MFMRRTDVRLASISPDQSGMQWKTQGGDGESDEQRRTYLSERKEWGSPEIAPAAETIAAMEEANARRLESFDSVQTLMNDLNVQE